jgi:hypothetical protein
MEGHWIKRNILREKKMVLTVEIKDRTKASEAEVAICFDDEGLDLLIGKISSLRGKRDHEHLMTPSWAGDELTEIKQGGDEYELVNHLRLVRICVGRE